MAEGGKKETHIMYRGSILHVSSWARLVALALLLGVSVLASLGLVTRMAHAQSAVTSTINTCDDATLRGAINNAASGDTLTFGCSGMITLSQKLVITQNLTLDGSGQSVTLDGNNIVQVLSVNGGVSFTLNALTVANGKGGLGGGGLFNNGGTVNIVNSTFANNVAPGALGGGLYNLNGTMNIANSTFTNNSAPDGGGLANNGGTMNIANSTFTNNSAIKGGGLVNFIGGTVVITNSTFANNSANAGLGGGLYGDVSIGESIVANNTGGNCSGSGTITSTGYNLSSDGSCGLTGTGDLQNPAPQLASLASNGGPTQTIALLDGSPAIDHIPGGSNCPAIDQRGMTRPDDGETTCDIGSYESNYPPDNDLGLSGLPATITVNATSPQGAVVTYTPPTVVDEGGDNPGPSVSCTPASSALFAIGTTTVTCTTTDSDDTNSPVSGSFQVVVKGTAAQVNDLISLINGFNITFGLKSSLVGQLQTVLVDLNAGNTSQACSDLTSFINHVKSQSGKGLTVTQANQLIAAAKQVQAVLGC